VLSAPGGNPYFVLKPGRQLYYSNYRCVQAGDCDELEELWITVRGTRDIASCLPGHDVYYFGEEVDIYADGKIVSHDGEWLAGKHRAEPGIIMPESAFILGQRYFQEKAPGVALDRAEHVAADLEIEVPAGEFDDCIQVIETTPLEPGAESLKTYCPGIGLVSDGDLELVSIFNPRNR
jgi:hypothetical protein